MRWINVKDSTPRHASRVLVTRALGLRYKFVIIATYNHGRDEWIDDSGEQIMAVTAWAVLPAPYGRF